MIQEQETGDDLRHKFNGIYRAYVVSDEDPRDIGRIKVRIPGIYREDVHDDALPWAIPALTLSRSGGDNMNPEMNGEQLTQNSLKDAFNNTGTGGTYVVPAIGNHVWVWFDNGNHMNPVYFAMAPGENDYLSQKQYLKEKIDYKIQQIKNIKKLFNPETKEIVGGGWADTAVVNARQQVHSEGQSAPYDNDNKTEETDNTSDHAIINGGLYVARLLNINNEDTQGTETLNMNSCSLRTHSNFITMDIKPLFDAETKEPDRNSSPHEYTTDSVDKIGDTKRNINRFITSTTTRGGSTEIVDNRPGQENYYFIHKNFIENIDQNGSRKVFIGKNDPIEKYSINDGQTDASDDIRKFRSNDELLVAGDKKTHVLGNDTSYVRGNIFIQVDQNTQVDINNSLGIRIKKGDYDIIIEGEETTTERDENKSKKESGKASQQGDMNISIKNGCLNIQVAQNANINVQGQTNLKTSGDLRMTVGEQTSPASLHLVVNGDFHEYITGKKYETALLGKESIVGVMYNLQAPIYNLTIPKFSITGVISCEELNTPLIASLNTHAHGGVFPGNGISLVPFPSGIPLVPVVTLGAGQVPLQGFVNPNSGIIPNATILAAKNDNTGKINLLDME